MPSDTITKMLEQQAQRKTEESVIIERVEEWKDCLNRMLSTEDGKYFAKYLIKYCGVYRASNSSNAVQLIEDNAKRKVYLELIMPYLDREVKFTVENQ